MGCSASKETHAPETKVYDAHVRRRAAKHLALDSTDPAAEPPPPLKLAQRGFVADDAASRTPAITPQAEAGRCSETRRTPDAREARRPVDIGTSSSDDQQTDRCAQQGLSERRVSTEASCADVGDGGEDKSCGETGGDGSEELRGCRTPGVAEYAGKLSTSAGISKLCRRQV